MLRMLFAWLCVVTLTNVASYATLRLSNWPKRLFWAGVVGTSLALALILGLHLLRTPRGLAAQYYENLTWQQDPSNDLDRYFEADGTGQRVDRFIDFNANDFNVHTFAGRPFSVCWEGHVYLPRNGYRLEVKSNFGTWLYIDDILVAGNHQLDFGTSEARKYLREGWSHNEYWNADSTQTFVWGVDQRSEFYLGVDELADYTLSVRCLPFEYASKPQSKVTVVINDVELHTLMLADGWHTYSVPVPQAVLQQSAPGFFRVQFRHAHAVKPADIIPDSEEQRELAVAYDWVRLEKTSSLPSQPAEAVYSKGFHTIVLNALHTKYDKPFIQFGWSTARLPFRVVPEDYVFPELRDEARRLTITRLEREVLYGTLVYIALLIVFHLAWLAGYVIRPYFRTFLTKDVLIVGLICVAAFALRLAFIWERSGFDPEFYLIPPGTDQANYVMFARGIFRGYWPGLTHQPFYFNVLNAFYLALTFMLFNEGLFMTRVVTAGVVGVGTILCAYAIARRLFNRPIAYLTAGLCAFNGVLMFYDTTLISDPLKSFLGLATLWLLIKLQDEFSWQTTVAAGIVLGLNALARATVFLFLPVVVLWLLWRVPATIVRRIACCAVLCLVMFVTISPVTIRNYFSTDQRPFVLITGADSGFNLWVGNNPSSNGGFSYSSALYHEVRNRVRRGETTYQQEVLAYITSYPLEYLALEYTKLRLFWRGYEPANLVPYYVFRDHSKVLGLPWVNFVVIGPLSLIGLALALKTWKRTVLLYAFVGKQVGLILLFWMLARYRLPAVPVLSIFAAYTLWFLIEAFRKKQWKRCAIVLGLFALLYVGLNYPDAARYYEINRSEPMPFWRIFRYWDVFYTW